MRSTLLVVLTLLMPAVLSAITMGPDAGGYTGTDATVYSFVDISGSSGGASILGDVDDGTAALTLPFAFTFYGQAYTLVCISSNGALYFVASAEVCSGLNDFANTDLSGTVTPGDRPAVLPFWTDLTFEVPGAGAVFYQTLGAAGARRFVVQWNNAYPQGSANPVTFQVILSEGSNAVLFQYKTVTLGSGNPASNGGQATIGIRNTSAPASFQQIAWSFSAPVVKDQTALLFSGDSIGPAITVSANPSSIWPPNNKPRPVTVSGTITDGSGVDLGSATYAVADEYGQVQPQGSITVGAGGAYSVNLMLMASRDGNDKDGRTYTITIAARDTFGNTRTATTIVRVPHDQGQ